MFLWARKRLKKEGIEQNYISCLDLFANIIENIYGRLSFTISIQDSVFLVFTGPEIVLGIISGNTYPIPSLD